jgi:Protein of unknown function (DUF4232)
VAGSVVLACVTMIVAGCTGSSGSSAASGRSSSPPASTSPGSPGSGAPGSSGPASSSPAAPASPTAPATGASSAPPPVSVAGSWSGYGPCPDLQVKLGLAQGTSNTTYQVIDFTNRGSLSCILDGYPGVNLAGGTPVAPIGLPAAHNDFAKAKEIVLQPGAVANALLQITDAHTYSTAKCGPVQAQYLVIYLPDNAAAAKLAYGTTACSRAVRMLQVSGVSDGTGG